MSKTVVSNVTGEEWFKHFSTKWDKVIDEVGIVIEDEVHQGKNGTTVTLKKGSEVIIDDIRGRIKPQYRVRDSNGKIWFISALNVEIMNSETEMLLGEIDITEPQYRGGVRYDGSDAAPRRYTLNKTTQDELDELKKIKEPSDG
tara:strand:+ start:2084 stop:2515 length:432 start_codon:yes stop_codon:yes gene_type:complete